MPGSVVLFYSVLFSVFVIFVGLKGGGWRGVDLVGSGEWGVRRGKRSEEEEGGVRSEEGGVRRGE